MFACVPEDHSALFASKRFTPICSAVFISMKESRNSDQNITKNRRNWKR